MSKTQIKVVLSGGTCTGKTTTLRELRKLCEKRGIDAGFAEEAARDIIKESLEKGSDCLPWKNPRQFQLRVIRLQKQREKLPNKIIFIDRGKVDGLVYYWLDGLNPHPTVIKAIESARYDLVFFFKQLPIRQDSERVEDIETIHRIKTLMWKAYKRFGYEPIKVKMMSSKKRAEFVLEKTLEFLEKKQSK